ncbi:MAG: hypothetical protein RIR26_463 [Pseudomonadota bacterium]
MFLARVKGLESGASAASENMASRKINVPSLLLGFIGFATSLYALILHMKAKSSTAALGCDVNDVVNCRKVIGGEYGEWVGIPLGAFGMAYFGVVIALAILPLFVEASKSWMARWQMLVAALGAAVSLLLAYVSYFKVEAVCLVCSGVHLTALVNFVWTLVSFLKVRQQPQSVAEGGFLKLLAAAMALGVPPLLAGALLPLVTSTLGTSSEEAAAEKLPEQVGTPFPADWTAVAVSNWVGKGEDFRKGNDQAKVVVHMFSDLECPHCKVSSEDILAAQSAVGAEQVLFVYRNYPLSGKCNPNIPSDGHLYSCDLAMALRCAGSQRKDAFWDFKDWAFAGIDLSPEERQTRFSKEGFRTQAERLKLDVVRFEACMQDKVELPKIQADIEIGKKMGLTGTPLIVINGRTYSGERSPQGFTRAFRAALEAK